jgi:multidrug efflux pump subunit AcrA (membrane-fusion protein)
MGRRRFWLVNGSLVVVAAVIAFFAINTIFHKSSSASTRRTVTVSTGTIQSTVTASGNISAAQTEDVDFSTSGTVAAINVSVGQQVSTGETLATLDASADQASLQAAEDNLTAAEDNLALAEAGGETPPQIAQDNAAVATDESAVASAQSTLTTDQDTLSADQKACAKLSASSSVGGSGYPSGGSGSGGSGSGGSGSGGSTSSSTTSTTVPTNSTNPCTEETAAEAAVTQAQSNLTQAQNNLTQENLSLDAKRYVSPSTILQDDAQVTQAQETVDQDQKVVSETYLSAPISGTVTAINGTVGETVSGGGSSAASASSSSTSSGTGATGGGTGASTGASSSSSSSSSSSAFLVISNLGSLQVVAGFPEADAVKIKVGQPATATLSALTNVTIAGSVTAISPTPTVVSDVVTYDDTITLTNIPSDVQTGMSVTVAVVTDSVANALELPSSAITTTGGRSTVEVLNKKGKEVQTTVTTGLVGDTDTQILSGVSAGTTVVEPSVSVSATGTGTGTRTGTGATGFGGGGAGAFLGGGGGGF